VYRAVHRTWLEAQCTTKRLLVISIFLGYHFISRVNRPPPNLYPKNDFWEHFQLKQTESVFAYMLKTDKAIIMKLHSNIKQVKYYIMAYSRGTKEALPR